MTLLEGTLRVDTKGGHQDATLLCILWCIWFERNSGTSSGASTDKTEASIHKLAFLLFWKKNNSPTNHSLGMTKSNFGRIL